MLYELAAIARVADPLLVHKEAKELALTIGKLVIRNKGVVREVVALGDRPLPKIMRKANEPHFNGSHFVMLFDCSSSVQREILRSLKNDPRVIRSYLLKVDDHKSYSVGSSIKRAIDALKTN
ncbi:unnamed protein product [[Candida] boidinii]|uniref:Small ribosomal subunit protein bS6m n=1 Tax=Candida boidinii TaxID=5477 RepID=A0A9W6TAB8_CANBO|nr:hypothetical protein B5S30_g2419 [[Candida] boidinii]OWB85650.1 hypothetical protein B5S33_g4319 [[Candida] boidinii]GME85472.1 unnamed protein product [[Candida] boidinii]GME88168.1 unnamed protein product [[Candida] boidinii]GMF98692.1 unnamed protein product [[Candida] boidinii]